LQLVEVVNIETQIPNNVCIVMLVHTCLGLNNMV